MAGTEGSEKTRAQEFWAAVSETRALVESWPKWKQDAAAWVLVSSPSERRGESTPLSSYPSKR